MVKIHEVYSVSADVNPRTRIFYAKMTFPNGDIEVDHFVCNPDPTFKEGSEPDLNQLFLKWLVENEGKYDLIPYIPMADRSIEEQRENMPILTGPQFWNMLAHVDIDRDDVVAAIREKITDSVEAKLLIAGLDNPHFYRASEDLNDIFDVLGIAPTQADALWDWVISSIYKVS